MSAMLDLENLRIEFHVDGGVIKAVDGVSFSIRQGRTLALVGESGSGKSVVSQAIMGILPKTARIANELTVQKPQSPLAFAEDICLGLLFDVPTPSPDREFTLTIGGISKAGATVSVPPIHFERARGWEFDEIP